MITAYENELQCNNKYTKGIHLHTKEILNFTSRQTIHINYTS